MNSPPPAPIVPLVAEVAKINLNESETSSSPAARLLPELKSLIAQFARTQDIAYKQRSTSLKRTEQSLYPPPPPERRVCAVPRDRRPYPHPDFSRWTQLESNEGASSSEYPQDWRLSAWGRSCVTLSCVSRSWREACLPFIYEVNLARNDAPPTKQAMNFVSEVILGETSRPPSFLGEFIAQCRSAPRLRKLVVLGYGDEDFDNKMGDLLFHNKLGGEPSKLQRDWVDVGPKLTELVLIEYEPWMKAFIENCQNLITLSISHAGWKAIRRTDGMQQDIKAHLNCLEPALMELPHLKRLSFAAIINTHGAASHENSFTADWEPKAWKCVHRLHSLGLRVNNMYEPDWLFVKSFPALEALEIDVQNSYVLVDVPDLFLPDEPSLVRLRSLRLTSFNPIQVVRMLPWLNSSPLHTVHIFAQSLRERRSADTLSFLFYLRQNFMKTLKRIEWHESSMAASRVLAFQRECVKLGLEYKVLSPSGLLRFRAYTDAEDDAQQRELQRKAEMELVQIRWEKAVQFAVEAMAKARKEDDLTRMNKLLSLIGPFEAGRFLELAE